MLVYQIAKGKKHVINFMVDEMSDKTKNATHVTNLPILERLSAIVSGFKKSKYKVRTNCFVYNEHAAEVVIIAKANFKNLHFVIIRDCIGKYISEALENCKSKNIVIDHITVNMDNNSKCKSVEIVFNVDPSLIYNHSEILLDLNNITVTCNDMDPIEIPSPKKIEKICYQRMIDRMSEAGKNLLLNDDTK